MLGKIMLESSYLVLSYLFIYCGVAGEKLQVLMAPIRGFSLCMHLRYHKAQVKFIYG
jgi:hypothetical protein